MKTEGRSWRNTINNHKVAQKTRRNSIGRHGLYISVENRSGLESTLVALLTWFSVFP